MLDFLNPRCQSGGADGIEAVEGVRQVAQIGADPGDDLEDEVVACIEILPVDDAFMVKDAVAQEADLVQIALPVLAFVKTLWQAGEDGFDGTGKKGSPLFIVHLEEADPESKLKFRHDTPGGDGFAGLCDPGFNFGDFIRRPWCEQESGIVIPIDPPHQGGDVAMNGIAKSDFTKLERRIETLAKRHIEQVTGKSRAGVGRPPAVADRISTEPFGGKTQLDFTKEGGIHRFRLQIFSGKSN